MMKTDAFVQSLNGKPVAVFGLGVSGLATAKALMAAKANIAAWDDDEEKRAAAYKNHVPLLDFTVSGLAGYAALILSPGIPLKFPEPHCAAQIANDAGVEIIGDLEILHRLGHGIETIGVTGTNGKSTTSALIAHILKETKIDTMLGGNIGKPVLEQTLPKKGGAIVLEISSYQMDLSPSFRPDISVLLNISPDHLERHGGMDGYVASKEKIFEGSGVAVCGIDEAPTQHIYDKVVAAGTRRVIPVSIKKEIKGGVYAKDGLLMDWQGEEVQEIANISNVASLPGVHNQQNICAAYAVCRAIGINAGEIIDHIKTYPGLPHRQQLVRVINGVGYINDSKATNGDSAARAIACYNNIYLIAGGRPKEGGLTMMEPLLDRIHHVFLIGEAMDDFAKWLESVGKPCTRSHSLDVAVLEAHKMAQAGRGEPGGAGTVLLSPACASWDQFRSFEHRGEVFTSLVNALSEDSAA